MTPPSPTVSIVIPAYNEESTIRACVVAAIEQTVPADEILVIDNRSTDGTLELLHLLQREFPDAPLRVFSQDAEQGLVPTRNFGMDLALGEVIGRIDADSVLEPDWVEQVRALFADPTVAAATGPVIYYDMPLRRWGHRADDTLRRGMLKLARDYHFVFGSNMAVRASAWRDIRDVVCRDEADEMHEDIDISIHLFDRGHRVVYGSKMVAGMSARRLDDSPRDYFSYVGRFDRTYDAHGITNPALRAPMVIFSAIYPVLHGVRWSRARRGSLR
ncbi:glycosyltransferase family 2 protein [uncultured Schumannella sp.]|uniref:glycosyltransferase n=1 Tax=uncultured Schumannella sp. TaxID=1195956 RepID=UPI0025CED328|nr:glycosyltransferase family 2 protein [uncultured Schumannella sp.]